VPVELLRRAVADALAPLAAGDESFAPAEVFVGPPGVGKTTTIAKIAAQERVRHGARLGLVAADGFRVGAIEQLRLYAEIIGTPFAAARSARELDAAMDQLADGPALVDTAGRGLDERAAQDMLNVLSTRPGVRTHLVLSAATPVRDAARLLEAYEPARPARIVLTRLDEGYPLGPLVALLRAQGRPLSFLGTGQRVPEDLARATPATLAAHLLGEAAELTGDRA
jgi:flagellar biosynthesis protein FlhF